MTRISYGVGSVCIGRRDKNPIRAMNDRGYGATSGYLKMLPLVSPAFSPIVRGACMYKHPNCVNTIINKLPI